MANAQESQAGQDEGTQLDEVVVTGSRIRRDPTNAPTPLIQVSREALLTTGQNTVVDFLATIPALSQSTVPSDTTGSNLNDGGQSFANLRALGANRTLTLVDGRRHVGSNGGTLSVDVDAIPRLLIENIEIVTGGASSVYGADAVSGVLNFVLRKDFEGLQIDGNYGMINQDGQANKRLSVLTGANLLDDRLNLWAFAEYEDIDEVQVLDIDWLKASWLMATVDSDPTSAGVGPTSDGIVDLALFSDVRTLSRPRWGRTVLANMQVPSRLDDPEVPFNDCSATAAFNTATNTNCFNLEPGKTYIYEGLTGRLADFGQRIGTAGANRVNNIGGDGSNPAEFGQISRVGQSDSSRFAVGANFQITDEISGTLEAKYIEEHTFDTSQPVFFDVNISDRRAANVTSAIRSPSQFDVRLSDNAFLPTNVKSAIQNNMLVRYGQPTNTTDGAPLAPVAAPFARHALFGPNRTQDNTRTIQRAVAGLRGEYDQLGFINDVTWDLSYTYGEYEGLNRERGVDVLRFALAADAVVDTAGVVSGTPGQIVCRAQLIRATNPLLPLDDYAFGGDLRDTPEGRAAVDQCTPLNIFGEGNQSEAALAYIDAAIKVRQRNEQEDAIASFSGSLWDFWGAGPMGFAVGAEYRREFTSAIGRDADTGNRLLFLNTGPDFPGVEYDSQEYFGELSIPLFRDSFMGEYAELSGSYRTANYSTVGDVEVYGLNLVYRPIPDIAIKTSFNNSIRVPSLGENFAPFIQTFANGFVDPCATAQINAAGLGAAVRQNRITNCTAQAAAKGLAFDFAGATATNTDDFAPVYSSGIAGVIGGNPNLKPEESKSFTFSTVFKPRFIPDFSLVLDYYEIEIEDVIAAVTAQIMANNCVSGPGLNPQCNTLFRNSPTIPFGVGAPQGDPVGGFIQGSFNLAKLQTRGMDFTGRYRLDLEEHTGHNWGRLDYAITGSWLLEQKTFLDQGNPASFTELAGSIGAPGQFPRVRFTSSLTWTPNDIWSVNWSVDWQSAQDIVVARALVTNADARDPDTYDTGNFARHDLTVRWNVQDNLAVRAGVVNLFDAEQARHLGTTMFDNFDPYGTRFFVGFNYTPY
ncbi:MAG: TonB-dependent receptor [Brevundimonas sp.]|uniref:TonB-dependent receptor domain-containing protein n=1 Tax=Brevundimonas sp. TaxID=1871086 RepID=UPI0024889ED7|nr:TonB-dependent receptor [Brevundimonas sp.]MDI1326858.1 TonB-dependent receptor [Brevundimonas sp.]